MAQTFPQLQSPAQNPPPEIPDNFGSFGGAVGNAGGMGVQSGGSVDGSDVTAGASVLKTLLGTTGQALGSRELTTAATALGGATGIYKLVEYFSKGAPGGLSGGLGAGAGIGAIVSGLLSVAAKETGNPDLQKAAGAAGAATSALGLAQVGASIASIVSSMGGVAAAGAAAGSTAAAAAGASAGIGVGAGAAFAPIAALMLASAISGLAGGEDPVGEGIADMMKRSAGNYPFFNKSLMQGVGQQGKAFGTLADALPYVQNKAELGQLINTYKNYIQTTTGIQLDDNQDNPYRIDAIPGVGPVTHGQATPSVDFSKPQTELQSAIDALYGQLPGDPISGPYGAPGGGLEGEPAMRAWTQHLDRSRNAPGYLPANVPDRFIETGSGETAGAGVTIPARNAGFYGPAELVDYPTAIGYGEPGYPYNDPRGGGGVGFPEPGQFRGEISPYWQQLMSRQNAAPGTPEFQPNTIGMTGGMRAGVGQPMGAFGGQRSPLAATGGATVSPNITQGLQSQTGFIPGGSKL